jgi:hypothetical protein
MHPRIASYALLPIALLPGSARHCGAQERDAINFNQFPVEVYRGPLKSRENSIESQMGNGKTNLASRRPNLK